jgi:DNA-binding transcriptional LysR family regulator
MFPMTVVVAALRAFTAQFPTVPPRIYVQSLGAAADLVLDGTCMIGFLPMFFSEVDRLRRFPLLAIELIPVAAPDHPLARMKGPIDTEVLHKHVQLVLTDRSAATEGRDYGVLSGRTWRLADLGAKQSMLLAGLGWGNMPAHLVADDIENGRLKVIRPRAFDKENAQLTMCGAFLADRTLGPAGRWMVDNLPIASKAR